MVGGASETGTADIRQVTLTSGVLQDKGLQSSPEKYAL